MRTKQTNMPIGSHRRMRSEVPGVGRRTSRPSWKMTGIGRMSSGGHSVVNGGWRISCTYVMETIVGILTIKLCDGKKNYKFIMFSFCNPPSKTFILVILG